MELGLLLLLFSPCGGFAARSDPPSLEKTMKSTISSTRLAMAATFALLGSTAFADTLTWDNGAATGNWNNATPDDAIFGATGVGTATLTEAIAGKLFGCLKAERP